MTNIQVLGPGCAKCNKLMDNVQKAVKELGLDCRIEKVTDMNVIVEHRVMVPPALVIDGEVRSKGKALSVDEIKDLLGQTK
ncbi:MAG: thioredoxin family protein [Candidatus Latescibacterota bacterium]